ncbi:hypothetical protein HYQ45_013640 [Verticillium longisporum]|uniref:Uncharacterized protein n=1 Tax=Verticillium longisporum TaxID=100787 RepID=A0A8I2ZC48_VERLO|nr:hypothetical protein HYQ45_013640 [Verticillium longisporum]
MIVPRFNNDDTSPSASGLHENSNLASVSHLQVICAWPLSGQYGFGARLLFYLLLITCVIARKIEWLRNTFLAATLLFPIVAALHGIVLAANHVDGAIDMDIFGAFQLCSLGILAAPVAARVSRTYFAAPGRLLSLTIEFYRSQVHECPLTDGTSTDLIDSTRFPYGPSMTCGLTCSATEGPFSALRSGAANNIYVIPAPQSLNFHTATLFSAGCCVHAGVCLLYMMNKILREKALRVQTDAERSHNSARDEEQQISGDGRMDTMHADVATADGPAQDASILDIEKKKGGVFRNIFRVQGVPRETVVTILNIVLFGGAGLGVLAVGERNFHSAQLLYETEPLSSIGQWSSIVTAVLAALGSLYVPIHADMMAVKNKDIRDLDPNRTYKVSAFLCKWQGVFNKQMVGMILNKPNPAPGIPLVPAEKERNPRLSETHDTL